MLNIKVPETEIGVVIARFQVHELHEGHRQILQTVRARHKKVLILIGSTPTLKVTRNNPLDYQTRMLMIREELPDAVIMPIKDNPSDESWSRNVDARVEEVFEGVSDEKGATLYGSRDSFIPYYSGKYQTVELDPTVNISATQIRRSISEEVKANPDFRHGVVYAAYNRYPVAFCTVDVACLRLQEDNDNLEVALVRKANDIPGRWRFPGGFLDPKNDSSIEGTAQREIREETGLEVSNLKFVKSFKVDDWRYRKELDAIFTSLFTCTYVFGSIAPGDDITGGDARFHPIDLDNPDALIGKMIPEHQPIMAELISYLKKEKSNVKQ